MSTFFLRLAAGIDRCSKFFFLVACWLTIALVFLTTEQVIARYFFAASSVALQELEWHLFGFAILLGMAHTLQRNEHVRVDILYNRFSERTRAAIDCLGHLFFLLPVCGVLILYGTLYMNAAFGFANPFPSDYWSESWFGKGSSFYSIAAPLEALLRQTILIGEVSADPGGLEARWIIKGTIPFAFVLLLLQSISELIKSAIQCMGGTDPQ